MHISRSIFPALLAVVSLAPISALRANPALATISRSSMATSRPSSMRTPSSRLKRLVSAKRTQMMTKVNHRRSVGGWLDVQT